jgi:malyl-CoA/(S)-citramalyl-CoA lyase
VVNIDLEDSVAPSDKDIARANTIAAISDVDWGRKTLSVRINGLDTPWWYRDVVDLLEQAGDRLDQIMIPKVGCAEDVYAVDALVTAVERAKGRTKPVGFEVIIESAAGISHVEEIAKGSPRLQAMSLGAADFAASMGMQTTGIGGTQENYYMLREGMRHWSDPWHWAQAAIVAACRTHGILPVDGPFGDFSDDEGFRAQRAARAVVAAGGNFPVPTLVTQGEGDALVRPEWTKPLAQLGNVEYLTLKGFNHHPFATLGYQAAVDEIAQRIGRR